MVKTCFMKIRNYRHQDLQIHEFDSTPGQSWCIFGKNNSGIDCFIELLSGNQLQGNADVLDLPKDPGILSFKSQQKVFEEEVRNDDSDFLDRIDPGTLVREFLPNYMAHPDVLETFAMAHCLDLGYRQLSSGQARKLLLLRELTRGATTLILENPFDGLDEGSCRELHTSLKNLPKYGITLLLCITLQRDIPTWVSHIAIFQDRQLVCSGPRDQVLPTIDKAMAANPANHAPISTVFFKQSLRQPAPSEELVFLRQGFAGYAGKKLFKGLNLTIHTGDHTLITGPNGCGKSTLLDILTGDNPKCYANDLRIFGKKRGSGESIWEIKKDMGIVSPSLHREHHIPGSALQIVISGLYDSIGLYNQATSNERKMAGHWLAWTGLSTKAELPFRRLSHAEQRLVLIARALIKGPKLLILDEPTHGLDDDNRNILLNFLGEIAAHRLSTILLVSHRKDEHLPLFRQKISLDDYRA
jgi:molybdate transport system ATP-binding protein